MSAMVADVDVLVRGVQRTAPAGPGPVEPDVAALPLGPLVRVVASGAFALWAATVTCFVC